LTARITVLLVLCAGPALADWRFWGAQDGLPETYTYSLGIDSHGQVWGIHGGASARISINDGYTVRSIAPPGLKARIAAGYGHVWALASGGLFHLEGESWKRHAVPQFDSSADGFGYDQIAVPRAGGRVLLLKRECLLLYSSQTHSALEIGKAADFHIGQFISLVPALDGGVWVSAELGVAKVTGTSGLETSWHVYQSTIPGVHTFSAPNESPKNGLTLTGMRSTSSRKVVVLFDGKAWQTVHSSESNSLRGWFDASGALWIQKGDLLVRRAGTETVHTPSST
jgi:hypothetical protein